MTKKEKSEMDFRLLPKEINNEEEMKVAAKSLSFVQWYRESIFNLHLDHHATADMKRLGLGTNAGEIKQFLKNVGPTMVQYHSKGHPGYTTYPTGYGEKCPALHGDILKIWRQACGELGIKFSIYYSSLVDGYQAQKHPEWIRRQADGAPAPNRGGPYPALCVNSQYPEKIVLPMLTEMLDSYDPDGLWFDGCIWSVSLCWCDNCKKIFRNKFAGKIPKDKNGDYWDIWARFHRDSYAGYLKKCADLIHGKKPSCLFASNWAYTVRHPDQPPEFIDYISGDVPCAHGTFGASFEAKFITNQGKPFDIMTFDRAHDFRCPPSWMKTKAHLLQESGLILSNGGRHYIWHNPRQDGSLMIWRSNLLREIGQFVKKRRNLVLDTESLPEIALFHSTDHHYSLYGNGVFDYGECLASLRGAHRALTAAHFHFDTIADHVLWRRIGEYQLVILAARYYLSDEVIERLTDYVRGGGKVLWTGYPDEKIAGTKTGRRNLLNLLGVSSLKGDTAKTGFVSYPEGLGWIPSRWPKVKLTGAKEVFPFYDYDDPIKCLPKGPAVVEHKLGHGSVVSVLTDVFGAVEYIKHYDTRKFAAHIIKRTIRRPTVEIEAGPQVELALRKKDNDLLVHLANVSCDKDLSDGNHYVEEVPLIAPFKMTIRCMEKPHAVMWEPAGRKLPYKWENNRIQLLVPAYRYHAVVLIKKWRK